MTVAPKTRAAPGQSSSKLSWLYMASPVLFLLPYCLLELTRYWTFSDEEKEAFHRSFDDLPALTTLREANGHTPMEKYDARPLISHHMHFAPGVLWSILMPLQFTSRVRARWPALHRASGYVFFSSSLSISLSALYFNLSGILYSHPNRLHIAWGFVPTVSMQNFVMNLVFLGTVPLAVQAAKERRFGDHYCWIVRHTGMGVAAAFQRPLIIAGSLFGDRFRDWIDVPVGPDAYALERDWFAFTVFASLLLAVVTAEILVARHRRGRRPAKERLS